VNGLAKSTALVSAQIRKIQTGIAQNYAILMVFGIVAILAFLLVK
jgi:hypothetical protein